MMRIRMKPTHDGASNCNVAVSLVAALWCGVAGCTQPEFNPTPPTGEDASLSDVIQLTRGFERAGEAYFSADMNWIIFQATPRGEKQYQMYIAPVLYDVREESPGPGTVVRATPLPGLTIPHATDIIRIGDPIRITPQKSRNTCGFFSPDGNSIVFASTAGKEKPDEPTSGYQREGGNYRWSYPEGMEIFRADGWQAVIAAMDPGKDIDLAKHPLTNNEAYDAEASYSPDGKWLCFTSNMTGDLDVYAMHPDGSGVVQLTHTPGYDGGPFFSPDGNRLVYRSDRANNNLLQIFVSDVVRDSAGNVTGLANERQLTRDAHVNWGPFWHPDGRHIVYATDRESPDPQRPNYEVWVLRDDGTLKTRITFSEGADILPVFSPDGKYLMWASKRTADKTTQVFVAKFKFPKGS
jgi:hypothetical protein